MLLLCKNTNTVNSLSDTSQRFTSGNWSWRNGLNEESIKIDVNIHLQNKRNKNLNLWAHDETLEVKMDELDYKLVNHLQILNKCGKYK